MRLTIERMRTLVLVAGVLLVVAVVGFLAVGRWKNPFNRRDLPKRLGIDIKQEANGVTYSHALGAHSQFKIHASKVVELKQGKAVLHDVKIELYGEDGSRVDRIEGAEFEYDQQAGMAKATGPVEITLMRPGVAPAIAPKAAAGKAVGEIPKGNPLASVAQTASAGEIHVKTSGLTFDQNSGVATTSNRVEFSVTQGKGSSTGATFDSQRGVLVLDRAVELTTRRGTENVELHAQHAEFERGDQVCRLRAAAADYHGGQATAADARILFRDDGTVTRLDATNGFTLSTATGGHLAAPIGRMDFDQHNQPRHGRLEGGVTLNAASGSKRGDRRLRGSAPTAELEFTARGALRRAHLERGVELDSEEQMDAASDSKAAPLRVSRKWRSPIADLEFRDAGHGQIEVGAIHGHGGVVVTSESQRGNGAKVPSRLTAGEMTGVFGPGSVLTTITATVQASIDETSANGSRQTTTGDRLEAHLAAPTAAGAGPVAKRAQGSEAQVQSAKVEGNVVLTQVPASEGKPVTQATATLRATAGRADYEGTGDWLHLTLAPRVEDGSLQLTADKIDVSKVSGDAFARGNVKASWVDTSAGKGGRQAGGSGGAAVQSGVALGGQGPAHVVAAEAQLHQPTGEVTFRGKARLWQQANSIAAPVIVLDRVRQTLVARSTDRGEPVRAVLVSVSELGVAREAGSKAGARPTAPSVIRVRGGDLKYSDAERKAVLHGGAAGSVTAETGTATVISNEVELVLLPAGNHAGPNGGSAQVDRMTARGHVVVSSDGRRGTGEQLVFSSDTGEYVLTGTAAAPPRMTDPARGTVTGGALIFHSRDDSVSIEGGGRKTTTETTAPK